ncbi:RluA family pseudouridine synthase, partial [Corynebacterium sp.]
MNRQMRSFPIPEGLEGMRADAALAKLLGLSRSATAQLCAEGSVTIDSQELGKSERLISGNVVSVLLPEPEKPLLPREELVEGMDVLYSDADIICVHKPVGVAAHPSVGWDGPTVIGGLRAAGYTVASSGPTERQGIVHRLDVGTSGVMVVASSERAYSALKHAFKNRSVKKTYHAVVQGLPDPI